MALLQKERIINTSLEEITRQNDKNIRDHHLLKVKEDLIMSIGKSLKVPHMAK